MRQERGVALETRNTGVAVARAIWIGFVDDDELAEMDWLKNLLAVALQMAADFIGGAISLYLPKERRSCGTSRKGTL